MKRIFIVYSHFSPAYKAGGPVSSLVNLVNSLNQSFQFFVFCDAYEIGESEPMKNILVDAWNDYNENVKVFYTSTRAVGVMKKALLFSKADTIYINGIFLPYYTMLAIYLSKKMKTKVVVAPRGMLQEGALAIKPLKKKIFLTAFRLWRLHQGVEWHATDTQEKQDIANTFGASARVEIAPNIPKRPLDVLPKREKKSGSLKLIYLSLITKKKNLHLVLSALKKVESRIQFDIYGPLQDIHYWRNCEELMQKQGHDISYRGTVDPNDVQKIISDYHSFILPTAGENFGHAIYESFSVGVPCIISKFTPWGDLDKTHSGRTVNLDSQAIAHSIQEFVEMPQSQYDKISQGAFKLSKDYFGKTNFQSLYENVFK